MKKNKEWLIGQVDYLKEAVGEPAINDYSKGLIAAYNTLGLLIDQLEEPEQYKVVIPQFVGDFIKRNHRYGNPLIYVVSKYLDRKIYDNQIQSWIYENTDTFFRAYMDDYSVEKEKLYKVLLPGVESLDRQMCMHEETKVISFADDGYNSRKYSKDDEFIRLFTEQEIKAIDERFWAFAEEVTD